MDEKSVNRLITLVRHRDILTMAGRKEATEDLVRRIEELFAKLTPSEALPLAKKLNILAKGMLRKSLLGR